MPPPIKFPQVVTPEHEKPKKMPKRRRKRRSRLSIVMASSKGGRATVNLLKDTFRECPDGTWIPELVARARERSRKKILEQILTKPLTERELAIVAEYESSVVPAHKIVERYELRDFNSIERIRLKFYRRKIWEEFARKVAEDPSWLIADVETISKAPPVARPAQLIKPPVQPRHKSPLEVSIARYPTATRIRGTDPSTEGNPSGGASSAPPGAPTGHEPAAPPEPPGDEPGSSESGDSGG
jgi:hypothetical protein